MHPLENIDLETSIAKEVYESIMKEIKTIEDNLPEGHVLCVSLPQFPHIEITTIGRRGDYLLFFEGYTSSFQKMRMLVHHSQVSLLLVDTDVKGIPPQKPKARIGFVVEK